MAEKREADDARIIALAAEAAIKAMRAHVGDETSFWDETRKKLGGIESNSNELIRVAAERAVGVVDAASDRAKAVLEKATATTDVNKRWHIGKEIPLILIAGMILQTIGVVIWITQLSGNVGTLITQFAEFKLERSSVAATSYTREDARRDRELIDQKLQSQLPVDREFERRINGVEGRLDRLEHK
jgi:hypothetical protein